MDDETTPIVWSINQIVADRLRAARTLRGWAQAEAAERLEPYLGERWSVATYSAAERSTEHVDRIRQFSADDLVAFAAAFDLPVQFFFLPRIHELVPGEPRSTFVAGNRRSGHKFELAEYLRAAFGSPAGTEEVKVSLTEALHTFPEQFDGPDLDEGPSGLVTLKQAKAEVSKEHLEEMRDELQNAVWLFDRLLETGF